MEIRTGRDPNHLDGKPEYKSSIVCEYVLYCGWNFWKKEGSREFYTKKSGVIPIAINTAKGKMYYPNLLDILENLGKTEADFFQWLMTRP